MEVKIDDNGWVKVVGGQKEHIRFINLAAQDLCGESWEDEAIQICTFYVEAYRLIEKYCPHEWEGLIAKVALGEKE